MHCIMSNNDSNSGHKRPLERQNEAVAFVISQEENEDGGGNHAAKRQRTAEPESPGVVSTSSIAMDHGDSNFNDILNMSVDSKPVQWWKQKPNVASGTSHAPSMHANRTDEQSPSCFICRRPHRQHSHQHQQHSHGNVLSHSLRSYFPTTKPATQQMLMDAKPTTTAAAASTTFFQKCTFCDRQACTSCTRQCEQCHFHFCSMCSTADFSGAFERSFCLDCARTRQATENDMHID